MLLPVIAIYTSSLKVYIGQFLDDHSYLFNNEDVWLMPGKVEKNQKHLSNESFGRISHGGKQG